MCGISGRTLRNLSLRRDTGPFHRSVPPLTVDYDTGAPSDERALAQTSDGFLWIGPNESLFRFDGVRFLKDPAACAPMPSLFVSARLVTPSNDVLIGFQNGGIALLNERVSKDLPQGLSINGAISLASRRDSALYAFGFGDAGLAKLINDHWQAIGRTWGLRDGDIGALLQARNGVLWIESHAKLYFLRPGAQRIEDPHQPLRAPSPVEGSSRQIWATDKRPNATTGDWRSL